jgi:broad specificity phosphatase PhoE
MSSNLWLIRHGETEWSRTGAHTGRTDIPLTEEGRRNAVTVGAYLRGRAFALVLSSPLERAFETCRLAGLGASAEIDPDLAEWDYGDYEGRRTDDIRAGRPDWSLWKDGVPHGESIVDVARRARAVIDRAGRTEGAVALFGHGHLLRILAACWLELAPEAGALFALDAGSVSVLGYERETRVISRWNLSVWERAG